MQQRFETFTVLIAKISRSIRRIKAEEMSEFHLKGPHVSCLYYLTQLGPLTAGQLCDRCEEDKAAVSRSLEYLEQNGYVTRDGPGHCREDRPAGGGRQRGPDTGAAAGHVRRPNLHQRPSGALGSPPKITERRNRLMTRIIIDSTIDLPEQYRRQDGGAAGRRGHRPPALL